MNRKSFINKPPHIEWYGWVCPCCGMTKTKKTKRILEKWVRRQGKKIIKKELETGE